MATYKAVMRPALEYAYCYLPTHMTLASGGSPIFTHVAQHLTSSAVTAAGSVHKCSGDNVVRMWL